MHLCLVSAVLLLIATCAQSNRLEEEQAILQEIFSKYDRSVRPMGQNGTTGPVKVEVNTYVRNIHNIDDVKMEYGVQLTFRQKWMDSRLRYNKREVNYVSLSSTEKLWTPDLFFSNEMNGHFHYIITPNNLVRIFPDGTVLYSTRVSLRLFCPMDLKNYPMDSQVCGVQCASYGYTTNDVIFEWKSEDPVQVTKRLYLPKFSLNAFFTEYCTSRTNTGEYSCLKLDFNFSRDITYYLLQAYMPTTALVLLSWVTFWLNPNFSNIRLGIWVGVLIAIIMVTTSIGTTGPQVSYIKAIDVWMGVCIAFIFCVLIELCLVNNAVSSDEKLGTEDEVNACVEENSKTSRLTNFQSVPLKWLNRYSTRAQRIDVISRIFFPASFAFFNFIYWLTYTSK